MELFPAVARWRPDDQGAVSWQPPLPLRVRESERHQRHDARGHREAARNDPRRYFRIDPTGGRPRRPDKGRSNGSGENAGPARQGGGGLGALRCEGRPAARRSTRSAMSPTRSATRSRIRSSAGPTRRSRWSPASASCSAPLGGAERPQGALNVRQPLGPAAGQGQPRADQRDLLRGRRHRRRDRAGVRHRGALHLARRPLRHDRGLPDRGGRALSSLRVIPIIVLLMARKAEERRVMLAAARARQREESQDGASPATLDRSACRPRACSDASRGIAMASRSDRLLAGWLISQMMLREERKRAEPQS